MANYEPLWEFLQEKNEASITLTFEEIEKLIGVEINHSFLNKKKDALAYGYQVEKIFLKDRRMKFKRLDEGEKHE